MSTGKYQLAIGDRFEYPVHLRVRDKSETKDFRFHLEARRMEAEEARQLISGEGDSAGLTVKEFLHQNITNWRGQRLVLDDQGTPAPFGVEAFDALLSVSGAAGVIYQGYIVALAASNGAEGARKN
jgi:hypothetical protein